MSDSSSNHSAGSSTPPSSPVSQSPFPYAVGTSYVAKRHIPPAPFYSDSVGQNDKYQAAREETLEPVTQQEWCLSHPARPGATDSSTTRHFTIKQSIRTGDQKGAQVVLTHDGFVAKIYDPLYYSFYDVDFPDLKLDVSWWAHRDYTYEVAAYQFLSGTSFSGTATPKYYGSWTIDVSTSTNGSEVVREVRMILIEHISGICMCDIDPTKGITNAARENIMYKLIEIETDLRIAGMNPKDNCPRNIMLCAPDNDFTRDDLRVCLIDFGMATIQSLMKKRWDSGPQLYNPIESWWSASLWVSWGWLPPDDKEVVDWVWKHWGDGGRDGKYNKMIRDWHEPTWPPQFTQEDIDDFRKMMGCTHGTKRTADGEEKTDPKEMLVTDNNEKPKRSELGFEKDESNSDSDKKSDTTDKDSVSTASSRYSDQEPDQATPRAQESAEGTLRPHATDKQHDQAMFTFNDAGPALFSQCDSNPHRHNEVQSELFPEPMEVEHADKAPQRDSGTFTLTSLGARVVEPAN
ncbi:hypothetical protein P280DRAFT_474728 [Massarina eburnea CBS 473.64]|uniref:Protein kinase domain-containing protein n=1 Tax=Massarina eburnea CBS 473.64 TaxID=1395130 RepID=A0A6A6RG48_9PLEO|nr:hypothetical protein P280DRAFT_474728 [Massarina eburnea CBS 473.64]